AASVDDGEVSKWRPQRDSNPCFGLERATSWASGRWGRAERHRESKIIACPRIASPVSVDLIADTFWRIRCGTLFDRSCLRRSSRLPRLAAPAARTTRLLPGARSR